MIHRAYRVGLVALVLLSGCRSGWDDGAYVAHPGTPTAVLTNQARDYRCDDGSSLRITLLGPRAVVDTGYERYSLTATEPGSDTYLSAQDSRVSLVADTSKATLKVEGGHSFSDCAASLPD